MKKVALCIVVMAVSLWVASCASMGGNSRRDDPKSVQVCPKTTGKVIEDCLSAFDMDKVKKEDRLNARPYCECVAHHVIPDLGCRTTKRVLLSDNEIDKQRFSPSIKICSRQFFPDKDNKTDTETEQEPQNQTSKQTTTTSTQVPPQASTVTPAPQMQNNPQVAPATQNNSSPQIGGSGICYPR